jgi:malic enzyme
MAPRPIIFALANPDPEIRPEITYQVRKDVIMATGRSDYPNQVNNVLCFPYIFRGALDVRATCINQAMLIAAVHAIRFLAHEPIPETVFRAYAGIENLKFGPNYILPKPVDPRLLKVVPAAVAKAAVETAAARKRYPAHYI